MTVFLITNSLKISLLSMYSPYDFFDYLFDNCLKHVFLQDKLDKQLSKFLN